ncbi:hypothetical protein Aduo_018938 [Ancylostoma duodenale]
MRGLDADVEQNKTINPPPSLSSIIDNEKKAFEQEMRMQQREKYPMKHSVPVEDRRSIPRSEEPTPSRENKGTDVEFKKTQILVGVGANSIDSYLKFENLSNGAGFYQLLLVAS